MSENDKKGAGGSNGVDLQANASASSGEELRVHPRLEVTALVDCTGRELLLNHRVSNISLGGICILSESVEDEGTIVDLVINFPEIDASMSAQGVVVWSSNESPCDMGIRYIDLDDERRNTLRRYLSNVEET